MDTYEKKYKEAQKWVESIYPNLSHEQQMEAEAFFPELCESEDEKIRKELIEHIKDQQSSFISAPDCRDKYEEEENNKYNSWLVWLEKQGEQKPRYSIGDVLCDKSCTTLNKEYQPNFEITDIRNGMYICDKCSFPISQQDEYELVAKRIEQEDTWNKEDERILDALIVSLNNERFAGRLETLKGIGVPLVIDWLKSLKDKYTWKPSEKQMEALNAINVTGGISYAGQGQVLIGLYNDLKKLKGE